MEFTEDYTIKNGLGIRVVGRKTCKVIRKQRGEWQEIGQVYELPVEQAELSMGTVGIPVSVLAVAVRAYELDHPASKLRVMLTRRVTRPRLLEKMVANA
jgi:hypothetical protein